MSNIPINEPNRYVRQLQARIREQQELLDECERALSDLLEDGDKTDRDNGFRVLDKLRAQEKVEGR